MRLRYNWGDVQALKPFLLPLVAAIVLAVLFVVRPRFDAATDPTGPSAGARPTAERGDGGSKATPPQADDVSKPAGPPAPRGPVTAERKAADAMRARIATALTTADGSAPPRLDGTYFRQRIDEDLTSIVSQCHASAGPASGGRLTMQFTLAGARGVGGVVQAASVADDSDVDDPALVACVSEAMFSATFQPPPANGSVTLTYPFGLAGGGKP